MATFLQVEETCNKSHSGAVPIGPKSPYRGRSLSNNHVHQTRSCRVKANQYPLESRLDNEFFAHSRLLQCMLLKQTPNHALTKSLLHFMQHSTLHLFLADWYVLLLSSLEAKLIFVEIMYQSELQDKKNTLYIVACRIWIRPSFRHVKFSADKNNLTA